MFCYFPEAKNELKLKLKLYILNQHIAQCNASVTCIIYVCIHSGKCLPCGFRKQGVTYHPHHNTGRWIKRVIGVTGAQTSSLWCHPLVSQEMLSNSIMLVFMFEMLTQPNCDDQGHQTGKEMKLRFASSYNIRICQWNKTWVKFTQLPLWVSMHQAACGHFQTDHQIQWGILLLWNWVR